MTEAKLAQLNYARRLWLPRDNASDRVECIVEVEIDREAIAHTLGLKAFLNKSKRTIEIGGLIKVHVRPITNESQS